MNTRTDTERLAAEQQLRAAAVAQAQALRRQAIADFWSGAAQQLTSVLARRRHSRRAVMG